MRPLFHHREGLLALMAVTELWKALIIIITFSRVGKVDAVTSKFQLNEIQYSYVHIRRRNVKHLRENYVQNNHEEFRHYRLPVDTQLLRSILDSYFLWHSLWHLGAASWPPACGAWYLARGRVCLAGRSHRSNLTRPAFSSYPIRQNGRFGGTWWSISRSRSLGMRVCKQSKLFSHSLLSTFTSGR